MQLQFQQQQSHTHARKNSNCKLRQRQHCIGSEMYSPAEVLLHTRFPVSTTTTMKIRVVLWKNRFSLTQTLDSFLLFSRALSLSPCFSLALSLCLSLFVLFLGTFTFGLLCLRLPFHRSPLYTLQNKEMRLMFYVIAIKNVTNSASFLLFNYECLIKKIYMFLPRPIGMCTVWPQWVNVKMYWIQLKNTKTSVTILRICIVF